MNDQCDVDRHGKKDKQHVEHQRDEDSGLAPLVARERKDLESEHKLYFNLFSGQITFFVRKFKGGSTMVRLTFAILLLLIPLRFANASEVMFEGYYKIELGGAPIGYTIERYEYDKKTKTFLSTYFLKTNKKAGNIQESLKAKVNNKFQPISYQYTNDSNGTVQMVDATFKGLVMKVTKSDGKTAKTLTYKIPKGTFLSSFLGYLMLQKGLKAGEKFTYSAVAEEEGNSYNGQAWVQQKDTFAGQQVFKVLNTFKGSRFISFITPKGEVLGTNAPDKKLTTVLMATPVEATKGQLVPNKSLRLLFGNMPTGKVNVLSKKTTDPKGK